MSNRSDPLRRPDDHFERLHGWPAHAVAGVDEVGRGPLAGPVVAAAVCFRADVPSEFLSQLDDSKRLTARKRALLAEELPRFADTGVGMADVAEIDRINILRAAEAAMVRAIAVLNAPPSHALIDGNRVPAGLNCPATPIVKGDQRSVSIAAASVLAKVTRDRIMTDLAVTHPGYGWERNAGYGTAEHKAALARLGPTPHHRTSFAPVAEVLRTTA